MVEVVAGVRHDMTTTCGDYDTESDAERAFDDAVVRTKAFAIYRRVRGTYSYLRPGQDPKRPEIDRILFPLPAFKRAGWPIGPVGAELKRSGKKIGPPLSQLLDYGRASFDLGGGLWVNPAWNFLFPMPMVAGNVESIVAQQRLGGIYVDEYSGALTFHSARVLAVLDGTDWEIRQHNFNHGRKTGSR